ncbi:chitin-binding protein [Burkholderia ubonensis]|uniref:Chitin-binding protein n=1 Tax=Burkholderia ubonensis TaxID=101571 RepID=A0A102NZM3_9BURK|nr:lytic polysaccharide monooxygenase [Burkholderia ubonensis]AOI74669.1 chitin-binding protein [Burkholderia ubonensis]KUZ22448.1 chitin-binding protein [Burkholderia ubonensis]KUZ28510.1 chitin-binding protein [Burkholderia ubonensis]KUZ39684.1 chitin-binding protein [Burkholderia ubonensis]KUZ49362.1 chitin-binding protein [Burkholderia ubonensis]
MAKFRSRQVRHGHVFSPESRATFAYLDGKLGYYDVNSLEAGKFFPASAANLTDPVAPTDIVNNTPPADGQLASGGFPAALFLDEPGTHWQKHPVSAGDVIEFSWNYSARHAARRWNYFITKRDWDPQRKLSRDQFEAEPFHRAEYLLQPYWEHEDGLWPPAPTTHEVVLPEREGYHVVLAVWEVANTGNAFYQVVDFEFGAGGGQRPTPPTGLHASEITTSSIELSWQPSSGTLPIDFYSIYRGDQLLAKVDAEFTRFVDRPLDPDTEYAYYVRATDIEGGQSGRSETLAARTLGDGEERPPKAPTHLHSMGETAHSVHLMWGESTGSHPIKLYRVYRNGVPVGETAPSRLELVDTGLTANTEYRYFVAAEDSRDWLSLPSNVLIARTTDDSGARPAWETGVRYEVGDEVSYQASAYRCLQAHTSNPAWTPVETINVLWVEIPARRAAVNSAR